MAKITTEDCKAAIVECCRKVMGREIAERATFCAQPDYGEDEALVITPEMEAETLMLVEILCDPKSWARVEKETYKGVTERRFEIKESIVNRARLEKYSLWDVSARVSEENGVIVDVDIDMD